MAKKMQANNLLFLQIVQCKRRKTRRGDPGINGIIFAINTTVLHFETYYDISLGTLPNIIRNYYIQFNIIFQVSPQK